MDCPQCGNSTKKLHEGYCKQCYDENQCRIDEHNENYERWQRLTDQQRLDEINRSN